MTDRQCSRGWGRRCAASKGKRCKCACGGDNHAGGRFRQPDLFEGGDVRLTDQKVFERKWDNAANSYKNYEQFLADAPMEGAFKFERVPDGRKDLDGKPSTRTLVTGPGAEPLRQQFVVHSPDGFEWGYGGSGPGDLALNLLGVLVPPPEAWRLHHEFKRLFIAPLPDSGGSLTVQDIRAWLHQKWTEGNTAVPS